MKEYKLDGSRMIDMDNAIAYIGIMVPELKRVHTPDELWDTLVRLGEAMLIRLNHVDVMCASAGADGNTLLSLLTDAAEENPLLRVVWQMDGEKLNAPRAEQGRVCLVNGSSRARGATGEALFEMAAIFEQNGLRAQVLHIGGTPLRGCAGCGGCRETGLCVFEDSVNELLRACKDADGLVFGTPVHCATMAGAMSSFMERFFCARPDLRTKPVAAVCVARRAGVTAALDQMNRYFCLAGTPIVTSQYLPMIFGASAEDVHEDAEGLQTLRSLARNMVWLIRCIKAGIAAGVALPESEERVYTDFIR